MRGPLSFILETFHNTPLTTRSITQTETLKCVKKQQQQQQQCVPTYHARYAFSMNWLYLCISEPKQIKTPTGSCRRRIEPTGCSSFTSRVVTNLNEVTNGSLSTIPRQRFNTLPCTRVHDSSFKWKIRRSPRRTGGEAIQMFAVEIITVMSSFRSDEMITLSAILQSR